MNFKSSVLLTLVISMVMVSCHRNKLVGLDQKIALMELSKSACFGPCPNYILKIYNDRTVEFNGRNFTAVEGVHTATLSKEEFKSLIKKFEKADLNELADSYTDPMIPDLQVVRLNYSNGDYSKTIAKHTGEPENAEELVKELEKIALSQGWLTKS